MTHDIEGRGAALRAGASSTAAWLRGCCRQRPAIAHAEVRLAAELDADLPALAAALAAGQVSHESARVVADTLRRLPAAVDADACPGPRRGVPGRPGPPLRRRRGRPRSALTCWTGWTRPAAPTWNARRR